MRRLNEIPCLIFYQTGDFSILTGCAAFSPPPRSRQKKAAGRFSSAAWDKNEDKTLLALGVEHLHGSLRLGIRHIHTALGHRTKLGHRLALAAAGAETNGASNSEKKSGEFHSRKGSVVNFALIEAKNGDSVNPKVITQAVFSSFSRGKNPLFMAVGARLAAWGAIGTENQRLRILQRRFPACSTDSGRCRLFA